MDKKDRQIIRVLQQEGRITNLELAERVHLSPSPCLRRLKLLEKTGVIRGYTAIVDQRTYGLALTIFIRIRLERHVAPAVAEFEQHIRDIEEVLECYVMTGEADYLLRVVVESLEAYEQFVRGKLQRIPGIASIDSSFVYGTVKQSHVYPDTRES